MKLKVALQRATGPDVDVVVTADASAPVSAVARALLEADPMRVTTSAHPKTPTLAVVGQGKARTALEPEVEMGEAAVATGATIAVVDTTHDLSPGEMKSVDTYLFRGHE